MIQTEHLSKGLSSGSVKRTKDTLNGQSTMSVLTTDTTLTLFDKGETKWDLSGNAMLKYNNF